eukprot:2727761-Rhodomonas_salina.4
MQTHGRVRALGVWLHTSWTHDQHTLTCTWYHQDTLRHESQRALFRERCREIWMLTKTMPKLAPTVEAGISTHMSHHPVQPAQAERADRGD